LECGDTVLRVLGAFLRLGGLRNLQQLLLAVAEGKQDRVGMSFADVDEVELRAVLVGLVELFQVARLATKGRSGVAAKDEDDRLLALKAR
jgi:hypothetical protein